MSNNDQIDTNIKLVIFDMDGVLIDSCSWHYIALNQALNEMCGYEIPEEDHYKEFNGLATKIKLKKLGERGLVKEDQFRDIEDLKQKKTVDIINELVVIKQEKIDLIKYLKARNIKVACYTNSIRLTAELILRKIGVFEYLDKVMTNQDVVQTKPNPEGYISCMNHFGVLPKDCKIIEDSPKGVEAATLSGANVLVVKNSDEVSMDKILEILA